MNQQELDAALRQTISDLKVSGGEKTALTEWLKSQRPNAQDLGVVRSRAFAVARESLNDPQAPHVLDWLEDVLKIVQSQSAPTAPAATGPIKSDAYFSPGDACVVQIVNLFGAAKKKCDVCVFTITDDRISRAMAAAHQRGVKVRLITDNEKRFDLGSDVERFQQAGMPVKIDATPFHMHHKFAVFDDAKVLTGSYNWTRGAAESNEENFVVTNDPALVQEFLGEFEKLWSKLENA